MQFWKALSQSSIFDVISKRVSRSLPSPQKWVTRSNSFSHMPGSFDLKGISSSAPCSSITVFRHGNLFSHLLHSFSLPGNMRATYSLAGKGEREKNLELIFLSALLPPFFPPRSFSKPDSPRKLWKEFKFRGASSYNGHATKAMCHIKKFRSKGGLPAWRLFLSPGDNTTAEFSWLFIAATFDFFPIPT